MKDKLVLLIFGMLILCVEVSAEANTNIIQESESTLFNTSNIVLGILAVFLAYAFVRLSDILIRNRELKIYHKYGIEMYRQEKNQTWFERFKRTATNAIPIEKESDIALNHDYDGIIELDNNLPPWWLWMFYISIIWSVLYLGYYHVLGYGLNSTQEYEQEMVIAKASVEKYRSTQANLVDETNVTALTDEASIAKGKEIFTELCVACHQATGAGGVGPNLTDEYWLHGNTINDIFSTIKYGVPEKGMISWQAQMNPSDMHLVSSFILTLAGTNPPNPKEPQGEFYGSETPIEKVQVESNDSIK